MECDICAVIAFRKARSSRKLKKLMLDCWQREYDRRPYVHFIFDGNVFEKKFHRKMTADDFLVILDFLEKRSIEHFEFLHCSVPVPHTKSFLKCLKNLVSVNFTHSNVPTEMFRYLAKEAENMDLVTLKLCGNIINESRAECLRTYLTKTTKLFYFDLRSCGINHITLAIIADGILQCKQLKSVDLSDLVPHHPQYTIDTNKISVILTILIWSSHLLEVHFRKSGIDGTGIVMMSENLSVSSLKILDIGANSIGPEGTDILFKALQHSNVEALIMPSNKIGDTGGKIIADNLCYTKLEHLDISYNGMSADTIELILTHFTKYNPMKTLNIKGNDFDSETISGVLHTLIIEHILNPDGIDVATTYVDDIHGYRIFPVENQLLNSFQDLKKLSNYCVKHKINPRSLIWFKENLRNIIGCDVENDDQNFVELKTQNFSCTEFD